MQPSPARSRLQLEPSRPPTQWRLQMTNSTPHNKRQSVPIDFGNGHRPDLSSLKGLIQCPTNDPGICKCCNESYHPEKCPLARKGYKYKVQTICNGPCYENISFTGCEWGQSYLERRLNFAGPKGFMMSVPECLIENMYQRKDTEAGKE